MQTEHLVMEVKLRTIEMRKCKRYRESEGEREKERADRQRGRQELNEHIYTVELKLYRNATNKSNLYLSILLNDMLSIDTHFEKSVNMLVNCQRYIY